MALTKKDLSQISNLIKDSLIENNKNLVTKDDLVENNKNLVTKDDLVENNKNLVTKDDLVENNKNLVTKDDLVENNKNLVTKDDLEQNNEKIFDALRVNNQILEDAIESRIDEKIDIKLTKFKSDILDHIDSFAKEIKINREERTVQSEQISRNIKDIADLKKAVFKS